MKYDRGDFELPFNLDWKTIEREKKKVIKDNKLVNTVMIDLFDKYGKEGVEIHVSNAVKAAVTLVDEMGGPFVREIETLAEEYFIMNNVTERPDEDFFDEKINKITDEPFAKLMDVYMNAHYNLSVVMSLVEIECDKRGWVDLVPDYKFILEHVEAYELRYPSAQVNTFYKFIEGQYEHFNSEMNKHMQKQVDNKFDDIVKNFKYDGKK